MSKGIFIFITALRAPAIYHLCVFVDFKEERNGQAMKENFFMANVLSAYNQNKQYFKVYITKLLNNNRNVSVTITS